MRDKLIELLVEAEKIAHELCIIRPCSDECLVNGFCTDTVPDKADFLIANGVTVQRWIPVSESLPKESGRYWVWLKFHVRDRVLECPDVQRFVAELNAFMTDGMQSRDVTHWMPIVPPKEGE